MRPGKFVCANALYPMSMINSLIYERCSLIKTERFFVFFLTTVATRPKMASKVAGINFGGLLLFILNFFFSCTRSLSHTDGKREREEEEECFYAESATKAVSRQSSPPCKQKSKERERAERSVRKSTKRTEVEEERKKDKKEIDTVLDTIL